VQRGRLSRRIAGDVSKLNVRDPTRLAYVTQTTLSVDDAAAVVAALKDRFPDIVGPKRDDICYATQNRQDAVKLLAPNVDVVIVVGSPTARTRIRLREVATHRGVPAYMVDSADELRAEWIAGKKKNRAYRRRLSAGGSRERGARAIAGDGRGRCA
jgi:4-hydroxy-3-methylbut-2-enyl diphosphate reductase